MKAIDDFLDNIIDEVVEAIKQDLSDPLVISNLRDKIDDTVSCVTGINVRNPFIYPYYQSVFNQYQQSFLEILGIAVSNPPESIDTTKEFIKEEVSEKVDTFADKLKKKLASKENNHA